MEQRGIDLPDPEGRAEWRSRGVPESSGLAWASRSTLRGTRSVECPSQGVRYASPLDSPRPVTEARMEASGPFFAPEAVMRGPGLRDRASSTRDHSIRATGYDP